ncbi:MAG: type VI secretion system baseplate subunit TssE [Desulfamplus sp.]|nr:type VI secretion system baseplate subunit TssE [Desulfamplus sp.]
MVERASAYEKILPSFIDRLTDHYPKAQKESREHRVLTIHKYRDSVLRDIGELLNNTAHPAEEEFEEFNYVKKSVLNYGIRSLSGVWVSDRNAENIINQIRDAIIYFEPRIISRSLQVNILPKSVSQNNTIMNLEITGELWTEPVPEKLYIKTEIDLETGLCRFSSN